MKKGYPYYSKPNVNRFRHSQGFTLLEALISMAVGVFILGGVITNFISTKTSDKTRMAISEMDSNARIAMQILRQTISHGAYPSINNVRIDKPFYSKSDGSTTNQVCRNGIKMSPQDGMIPKWGQYTRDRSLHRGDVLTTVNLADNPCLPGSANCQNNININPNALVYSDCTGGGATRDSRSVACSTDADLGMSDPTDAKIYSTFYLGNPAIESQKGVLYCRGNRGGTKPMADNIHNMQFLYGVVFDKGTENEATRYLKANDIEKGFDKSWGGDDDYWGMVDRVKVGLLMYSSEKNVVTVDSKDKYLLLGEWINVTDKKRLYRVYTSTIYLPNKSRGQL